MIMMEHHKIVLNVHKIVKFGKKTIYNIINIVCMQVNKYFIIA